MLKLIGITFKKHSRFNFICICVLILVTLIMSVCTVAKTNRKFSNDTHIHDKATEQNFSIIE